MHTILRSSHPESVGAELRLLSEMGEAELRVLADTVIAPARQKELSELLR